MNRLPRHPPSKRIEVADLMRTTDLPAEEIAARTGIPYPTVCKWNQRHGWRPTRTRGLGTPREARWSAARLMAVARVHAAPDVDPGDLAVALGARRERAHEFFRGCGLPERGARPDPEGLSGSAVRGMLRAHVARQIAAFDALLCGRGSGGVPDPARVLRDLGGLKKLLDDLDGPGAHGAREDADEPEVDLPALRAEIARRYGRFLEDGGRIVAG